MGSKPSVFSSGEKYSVIYADPPWDYKGGKQHTGSGGVDSGSAQTHYPTMSLDDIKQLEVARICEKDALCFMWTSSPHLDQAISVLDWWGFDYKTIAFVWYKEKPNPGYYTMSECEICIVGKKKKGKIPQPRGARNIRQFLSKKRGRHSEKPAEIRQRIEQMFPAHKRIELFARESVDGWDCWGNEV